MGEIQILLMARFLNSYRSNACGLWLSTGIKMLSFIPSRKECIEFGYGDYEIIEVDHPGVLAQACHFKSRTAMAVQNFTDEALTVTLEKYFEHRAGRHRQTPLVLIRHTIPATKIKTTIPAILNDLFMGFICYSPKGPKVFRRKPVINLQVKLKITTLVSAVPGKAIEFQCMQRVNDQNTGIILILTIGILSDTRR